MAWRFNPFTGTFDYYQTGGTTSNSFATIQPITGTSPTAASPTDTLTLSSASGEVGIAGNSSTDNISFTLTGVIKRSLTFDVDNTYDLGVWNGNRLRNGSFSQGLNVGTAPDRQDAGVIECGSATSLMIQFGTINGMLPHTDGNVAFRDKAMGTSGQLYGLGKAKTSAVMRFFKYDINLDSQTDVMTIDGATGNVRVVGNLGVGNSATGSTLGSVVKKIEIFDASGTSLGFIPVYNSIT